MQRKSPHPHRSSLILFFTRTIMAPGAHEAVLRISGWRFGTLLEFDKGMKLGTEKQKNKEEGGGDWLSSGACSPVKVVVVLAEEEEDSGGAWRDGG